MTRYLVILLISISFANYIVAQKKISIPENKVVQSFKKRLPAKLEEYNLRNLENSIDSINIRIWNTHTAFTLSHNSSTSSTYTIFTTGKKPAISTTSISNIKSQKILRTMLQHNITQLKDDKFRGIDGSHVFIEISTKDEYKILSYWSPTASRSADNKAVVSILNSINQSINSEKLIDNFMNSLAPGAYRWGMSSIQIDKFLDMDTPKSDFYLQAEQKIKSQLNITDSTKHWNYPLIQINHKPARISNLNEYKLSQVSKFKIIKPDNKLISIYGIRGSNGVVIIETK